MQIAFIIDGMNEIEEQAKEKKGLVAVRWIGTILSLAVLVWLLSKVGWREALESFGQIPWWMFLVFILIGLTSRFATFGRWNSLLSASAEKMSWKDSLKLTFAGLFASNVLPTTIGGDVVRLAGAIRLGISGSLAAASLVVDRLIGMTGMVLMLPFAIRFLPLLRKGEQASLQAMAGIGFLGKIRQWFLKNLEKVWLSVKRWIDQPFSLLKGLGFTLIHQLCVYLVIKLFINAMGEDLPILTIAGIWSLTYFITLLPISINGLGLQEVTVTNLFSVMGGISVSTSIALAIFLRILWMLVSLPGAFFVGDLLAGKKDLNLEESKPE